MSTQYISNSNPIRDEVEKAKEKERQNHKDQGYTRTYPRMSSVRLSKRNIDRITSRATRYNQSLDDIVTILLGQLEYYEKLGYDTPKEGGSF
jgi:hypothetical protein